MNKNLNPKDYFDLDHINYEVKCLTLCCLDLASIVDQPIDKDGLISVRFTYAAELIHNAQQAARELTLSFDQINDYLNDLRNKIEK